MRPTGRVYGVCHDGTPGCARGGRGPHRTRTRDPTEFLRNPVPDRGPLTGPGRGVTRPGDPAVCRGAAPEELLETYEAERAPVGHGVRRLTDRAFTVGTSSHPALRLARTRLAPFMAPLLLRATAARARLFRTVSELGIHYRRGPASGTGPHRPRQGPRAGDRLPDTPPGLQRRVAGPGCHLLLTGPDRAWPEDLPLGGRRDLVSVHRLGGQSPWPGITHALVRPDGYVGYLARGTDQIGRAHV